MRGSYTLVGAIASVLAAGCGGGGSQGSNQGPLLSLSLSPSSLAFTTYEGDARQLDVLATVTGDVSGNPFVVVSDPQRILGATPAVFRQSETVYGASLELSGGLPVGNYRGALLVEVCSDRNCNSRLGQTSLPYNITVRSDTNLTTLSPLQGAGDWLTYQGGPEHLGYVPVTLNPANFTSRWKWQISPYHPGSPQFPPLVTVAHGLVYVVYDTGLYVVREADADTAWIRDLGSRSHSPPAVSGNAVFVVSFPEDEYPQLKSYVATTGEVRYSQDMNFAFHGAQIPPDWPAIEGDLLVYSTGSVGAVAHSALDGTFLWRQQSKASIVGVSIDAENVYYVGQGPSFGPVAFITLDRTTGAAKSEIANPNNGSCVICATPPTLAGAEAFANLGNYIAAYDRAGSRVKWSIPGSFGDYRAYPDTAIAVTPTAVYATRYDGARPSLIAISRETGEVLWSWSPSPDGEAGSPPGDDGAFTSSVIATDNLVFVSTEKAVYAVSTTQHTAVWSYPFPGPLAISANGILYVARIAPRTSSQPVGEDLTDGYVAAINLH